MRKVILYLKFTVFGLLLGGIFSACQQETPVTSIIHIDAKGTLQPVNPNLYGITLEEINHAIDGGLYAEMIQNRSFEDGVPPLNCPFDYQRRMLKTPNGFEIPFIRPDSFPGWRPLSPSTSMYPDRRDTLGGRNKRSMLVSVTKAAINGRGGVAAEGYHGLSIRKGEAYQLSFQVKGTTILPKEIHVALEDSIGNERLSDVCTVKTNYEWKRIRHKFIANANSDNAILTFSTDSNHLFWLDVVSLFPEETWKGRKNGQRQDLMEAIAKLNPKFVRFPGGAFAEGYTAGTYPIWKETIGDIAERKHFWGVWGYGTTNGTGYHEYLQICEDLGAEPIYVINSGITNMYRRPRYESITEMDKLVQEALDAIGYANYPTDSVLGAMRAKNGHPKPFNLKYIEIGSENYGHEYTKRFDLFRKAIHEKWPDITVISNRLEGRQPRNEWRDIHFNGKNSFYLANESKYSTVKSRYLWDNTFVGEFGNIQKSEARTMAAAIGEACFLIGIEKYPNMMTRIAYSPVLGHACYTKDKWPLLLFNNYQVVPSPSYYLMQLFGKYRGDEVIPTKIETYMRPNFTSGYASIYMFDNSFEINQTTINNNLINEGKTVRGKWDVSSGKLTPIRNRWNYILLGDSALTNYEFSTSIKRTKGSGPIQFRVRNNGKEKQEQDYICFELSKGKAQLYHQSGNVTDTLSSSIPYSISNNIEYHVQISCQYDSIQCFINDQLVLKGYMPPYPSLASVTTIDHKHGYVYIKVVNTTQHEEKAELNIQGISVEDAADVVELAGEKDARNTFKKPDLIKPVKKHVSFMLGVPKTYKFPPTSITILKFRVEK